MDMGRGTPKMPLMTLPIRFLATLLGAFAAIAVGFGMKFLARGFEQLNAQFGDGLRVWASIFVLVLLQMTAALRPILGTSDAFLPTEKQFFLCHWTNSLKSSSNVVPTR